MTSEQITVKTEPREDSYEAAYQQPNSQALNETTCLQNGHIDPKAYTSNNNEDNHMSVANKNFLCLLCDVICDNREDLRRHLKAEHKPNGNVFNQTPEQRAELYSPYLQFRYTCNLCGAKFKTFKHYFSHSMSHKGYGALQSSFNDAVMRSGRDVLKNYFDTEDGYPGSFRCDECKTVFMQRDSYAMHMMMRAMNETCQPPQSVNLNSKIKTEPSDEDSNCPKYNEDYVIDSTVSDETKQTENGDTDRMVNDSSKCLEDVTCNVDQDEYLKSVLDKVVLHSSSQALNSVGKYSDVSKPCVFCGQAFIDQDALAMHVMSIHADQMSAVKPSRNKVTIKPRDRLSWLPSDLLPLNCKYCGQKFVSRDSLAMHVLTHTQQDATSVIPDKSFVNKRKADKIDTQISHSSSKIAKPFLVSFDRYTHEKQTSATSYLTSLDLYCNVCSIQFYSKGDFDWHVRCRHTNPEAENEPLCLTTQGRDRVSNDADDDDNKTKPTRRNSFSIDENSRHHYVVPKRPVSADSLVKLTTKGKNASHGEVDKPKLGNNPDMKHKDLKIKKEIQKSMAIACVDALSSNEKRIIYSVFGDELIKPKDINTNTKQVDTTADKSDTHEKIANALSQENPATKSSQFSPDPKQIPRDAQITSPVSAGSLHGDLDEVLKGKDAAMCRFCEIIFLNKAVYYLHMGLHNVNNHWQCNVCGKVCKSAVDFAAHVIHM